MYKTALDFDGFYSVARSCVECAAGEVESNFRRAQVNYLANGNLSPDSEFVDNQSKVYQYLQYARRHGTLARIQDHIEPLAASIRYEWSGLGHTCWFRLDLFNATAIRQLADDAATLMESRNFFEYETWGYWCCKAWSADKVIDRIWGCLAKAL